MPPKQKAAGSQQSRPITSFFQPRPTSDTKPPAPTTAAAPSSSPSGIRPPSSPLDLPSSPLAGGTPSRRQQNAPLSRDTVFAASDDDDGADEDDDDDFLEDLMAKFDPKRAARQATPEPELPAPGLLETPKAKRIMTGTDRILSSPLTLNQKRRPRQFDMSTLMEDALRDDATTASSLENKRAEEAAAAEAAAAVAAAADSDARDKVLLDIVQGGGEGVDAHRVLRAVHRSSRGGKAQLRYCFFRTGYTLPEAPVLTKKKRPTGPWAPLVHDDPRVREQYLASGMPQVLIDRLGGDALPGELFDWILDDLCGQPSRVAQQEYVSLLSCCPGHVRERLTPQRLREVFDRLGADDHEEKDKEHGEESSRQPFPLSRHEGDPYQGRDWSPLRSVMEMLAFAAPDMPPESVAYAARALLRMAMDRFLICCPDVLPEHEFAMQRLLDALPGSSWDKFVSPSICLFTF